MTTTQYLPAALRTASIKTKRVDELQFDRLHSALGIATEAIELMEAFDKMDTVNMKEEIGDLLWYVALMCRGLHIDLNLIFSDTNFKTSPVPISSPEKIVSIAGAILDIEKRAFAYDKDESLDVYIDKLRELTRYMAEFGARYDIYLREAADLNIKKLRKRFPHHFANEMAIIRDLTGERQVLEGGQQTA